MKKIVFFLSAMLFALNFSYAQDVDEGIVDNSLVEKIDKQDTMTQELNQNYKFMVFTSCQNMETVLNDFVSKYRDNLYGRYYYEDDLPLLEMTNGFGDVKDMSPSVPGGAAIRKEAGESDKIVTSEIVKSGSTDFSETNVQVKGVDEPEILKVDGDYLYYYNAVQKKLYIIKSPLNRQDSSINIETADIVKIINIPQSFTNIQLFILDSKLVILADRYAQSAVSNTVLNKSNKTNVIIYDVSDKRNPLLVKLLDISGYYHDARMIDGQLYLITKTDLRFRYVINEHKVFGLFDVRDIDLNAEDIMPTSVEITKTTNGSDNQKIAGYDINVDKTNCNEIFYLLPNEETLQRYSVAPNFAIVTKVNILDYEQEATQKVIFGDVSQIHMSENSLYFTNYFYNSYSFHCPMRARCIMPEYIQRENTLLHKFKLDKDKALDYVDSTIIPGVPLNQYSMSEDSQGYFRILTKTTGDGVATNLYVLDESMDLYGSLEKIEPGEDFKSSRYIGDKLYLVTFQRIDPLFVVDIKDRKNPKIIGKLKMPGYSTYLHPYDDEKDGIQYLIGLGVDTKTNEWGGVTNGGIKIDFYKVNYKEKETSDSKCRHLMNDANGEYSKCVASVNPDNIRVDLEYTKVIGENGSWSEALENPRMFVWDKTRKVLILPVILKLQGTEQKCETTNWKEGDLEMRGEKCEDVVVENKTFAGLKGYTIDKENGIIESISKDYYDLLKGKSNYYDQRQFRRDYFRVGYLGDVVYGLNNKFGHFFVLGNDGIEKYVYFDKTIMTVVESDEDDSSNNSGENCYYDPPAPDEPVCQMYCGKRWVMDKEIGNCTQIEVSAACSCPGFDTEELCEKSCK